MSPDQKAVDLADAVCGLVRPFPAEQNRLDREFAGRLRAYMPILEAARAAGLEDLARTVAPAAMVIGAAEIEFSFTASRSRTSEAEIRIRAINAGFQRRFDASQSGHHRMTIALRRSAVAPDGSGDPFSRAGSRP